MIIIKLKHCSLLKKAFNILLVLVCVYAHVEVNCNPIHKIEVIDSRKGLSSDNINLTFQDSEGYLWFLTHDGINKYDGYNFNTFKPDYERANYFNSGNFNSCCEDAEGNIWFGSYGKGINVYSKKKNEVSIINDNSGTTLKLSNNFVKHLYRDSKNRIWIATDQNIDLYIPDSGKIISFLQKDSPAKNYPEGIITRFYEDREGHILVGVWDQHIYLFDEQTWDFKTIEIQSNISNNELVRRPWTFCEDSDNNLWIGTWGGGLIKTRLFSNDSLGILQHYTYKQNEKDGLLGDIIFSIINDNENRIWIATPYGLNIIPGLYDRNARFLSYTNEQRENTISSDAVRNIFQDNSNIIWLSTFGGGINKIDANTRYFQKFTIPTINSQIKSRMVKSFYFDENEELYVGIRSLGFGKYDIKSMELIQYNKLPVFKEIPFEINTANCFYKDTQNNLWIGTRYYGLFQIEAKTNKITHFLHDEKIEDIESRHVNVIEEDFWGNIWVGTNDGLFKLVRINEDFRILRYAPETENPYSLIGREINALHFTKDSTLIIGTNDNGLSITSSSIKQHYPLAFENISANRQVNSLKTNVIYDVEYLFDDKYLLSTGLKGLYVFDKSNYTFYTPPNSINLENTSVYDILPDRFGMYWLSTNKGLFQVALNPNDFSIISQNYGYEDGLQGNIFAKGAVLGHKNKLYFGGYHGFNIIDPDSMNVNYKKPPMVFTSIKKSGKEVTIYDAKNNKLKLNHKDYSVSVEFSALSYSKPQNSTYFYKLEGFDKDWKETDYSKREINYTNLNAGKYEFLVYASNLNGSWKTEKIKLQIDVSPAPSRTWWAYSIYAFIIMLILSVIYLFNIKSIKMKQALEIEKLDRHKSEKLNQFKFRFFTNISHELLTPLSVISFAMEEFMANPNPDKDNLNAIQRNVSRLMNLITQLLDFRKMESGSMRLEVRKQNVGQFLKLLIDSLRPLANGKQIQLILEGKVDEPAFMDIDKIEKVVVNLVSNAIKYTPEKGMVVINYGTSLINEVKMLSISVIDSGTGIDEEELPYVFGRFYRVKSVTGKSFGAGIGLALAKGLVEVHKGTINAKNAEQGAIFTVNIPSAASAYSADEISVSGDVINYKPKVGKQIETEDTEPHYVKDDIKLTGASKEHTVLIVEDNNDFRRLLKNYLSNFYTVLEAEDGKQGLELAKQKLPNIIVSDVMMPNMDGIDMCKALKGNMETCHIMVVLLTAKVGDSDKYEGYVSGADSYIPKPVNMKILGARISSLLKQRYVLIDKITSGHFPHNVESSEINPLDKKFIKEVFDLIDKNLSNPNFNVAMLRERMFMSNSALYRKMTSLFEKTPVELIRYYRLNKAATLIKSKQANVSEAAFQCGFNDLSYFSSSFKKQFGVLPSQYSGA